MIRCTIELLPGLVEIANTAVRDGNFGEYVVVLRKCPPFAGALKAAWRKGRLVARETGIAGAMFRAAAGDNIDDDELIVAEIAGHHRTRRGVYDLMYRALRACGLEERNPGFRSLEEVDAWLDGGGR